MDLQAFRLLLSPAGQEALQAAAALEPREEAFLTHFTALSRHLPTELARPALETAILRQEARAKFPFASGLYLTRPALEQASAWEVSTHRAQRYRGFPWAADLGCSVGGDSLALARETFTLGLELDPLRLEMARANLAALNLGGQAAFLRADLTSALPLNPGPGAALFFDPARRSGSRRLFSVQDYEPPLSILWDWLPRFPALGVKISPGVDLAELEPYEREAAPEVEFVSLNGELKEAVLWFGPLRSARRRATLLPGPYTFAEDGRTPGSGQAGGRLPLSEPRAFLYEPDPAILRAGLVRRLGFELEAAQLDPEIAYLTADHLQPTPFARAWAVEDWLPFQLKRLRAYLRQRGVSRVVVKKRGSPVQPEELIHRLRLPQDMSGDEKVLFLTQMQDRPIVIIGVRVDRS
jgi:hypothetical protein